MSERFEYKNGVIQDRNPMDNPSKYALNSDEERLKLVEFMNAREGMIGDLNQEIDRLQDVIDNLHTDLRNLGLNKRRSEQIIRIQSEIIDSYKELADMNPKSVWVGDKFVCDL